MNNLKFFVSEAAERAIAVGASVSADDLSLGEDSAFAGKPVSIAGVLTAACSEFLFEGKIAFEVRGPCDRCLRECALSVALEVTWFLERATGTAGRPEGDSCELNEGDAGEETRHWFEGNEIDLAAPLREEVLLAVPAKYLCGEDCRGLCPKCGAQLNDGPCACSRQPDTGHEGFAALAKMFPRVKPETVED